MLRHFPELDLFPTAEDRRRANRRATLRLVGRPRWLLAAAAAIVLALTLTFALRWGVSSLGLPISRTTSNLILAVPVAIGCSLFGVWLMRRELSRRLRLELLDRGVPVCVRCGYDLLGVPGPGCPECGRAIDDDVQQMLESGTQTPTD